MKMKRFLLLLSLLLLLPLCALAVVTVPANVTEVEDEAFAGTDIDALIVPASVTRIGADVLSGSGASYIYLNGASTVLADDGGVPFVFGPAASPASTLSNFYDSAKLVTDSGLYYFAQDASALPLCAQSPANLSGSVTIPKLLNGSPVTSLSQLYLTGTGLSEIRVPAYLGQVDGVLTVPYQTMFLAEPTPDASESPAGESITWTTSIEGAYGDVLYTWVFEVNGDSASTTSTEPTVQFTPVTAGEYTVTVTAQDALGDSASVSGGQVTVTPVKPVYRALLVANSYPGELCQLDGPAADLSAMQTMLSAMSGTPYRITASRNITASGMQDAIASTFAGAKATDVSLFYFSGHGTPQGALVGTNDTVLSVYGLRSALEKIPGLKIVLLDCCYSGTAINRSADAADPSPSAFNRAIISALSAASRSSVNLEDAGYIVLTACSKDQTSFSLTTDGSHYWGVFTYALCYGSGYDEWHQTALSNLPADSNGDGAITLGEAYQGIRERVSFLNQLIEITQATQYYGDTAQLLWSK